MMRIILPLLTFLGGLYFFLEFLLPEKIGEFTFGAYHQELSLSLALISSMAVGLGIINLGFLHGRVILRKGKGSFVSIILIASFFVTLLVLSLQWYKNESRQSSWNSALAIVTYARPILEQENPPLKDLESLVEVVTRNLLLLKVSHNLPSGVEEIEYRKFFSDLEMQLSQMPNVDVAEDSEKVKVVKSATQSVLDSLATYRLLSLTQARKLDENTTLYLAERLLINGLFYPLGLSMFSLLAFYIAYAAYRSFRVRSIEAAVMMISAFVVLLGQVPQGVMYISEDLPYYRLWIMEYLSTPAFRAIYFSSAIAGLSLAVRMWLSLDKNPFSSK